MMQEQFYKGLPLSIRHCRARPDNPDRRFTGITNVSDGLKLDCRVKPDNDGWLMFGCFAR